MASKQPAAERTDADQLPEPERVAVWCWAQLGALCGVTSLTDDRGLTFLSLYESIQRSHSERLRQVVREERAHAWEQGARSAERRHRDDFQKGYVAAARQFFADNDVEPPAWVCELEQQIAARDAELLADAELVELMRLPPDVPVH